MDKNTVLCSYCGIEFIYKYESLSCPNCNGKGETDGLTCELCGGDGTLDSNGDIFLCPECRDNDWKNLLDSADEYGVEELEDYEKD
jgi:DnaJ-class molecular chaperone